MQAPRLHSRPAPGFRLLRFTPCTTCRFAVRVSHGWAAPMVALLDLWAESPLPTLDATVRSGECVMTLPVVDKESYKFSFSEWVMYAGQALQQAGFLQSDPT